MESGHTLFTVNLMPILIVGVNYGGINIATLDQISQKSGYDQTKILAPTQKQV